MFWLPFPKRHSAPPADTVSEAVSAPDTKTAPDAEAAAAGSFPEYKRVDEYWDRERSRFAFRESTGQRPRENTKMEAFDLCCFLVVRPVGQEAWNPTSTMVEIKSQPLRYICRRVIGNHEGIVWSASQLRIPPFVFFQYYSKLRDFAETLRSETEEAAGIDHLQLLLSFIRAEHADQFRELEELVSRGEITFELLKCLLLPETILYTACSLTGEPQACRLVDIQRVKKSDTGPEYWKVTAAYVEATGKQGNSDPRFGHALLVRCIIAFQGVAAIHSLAVYPLNLRADEAEVRQRLIARGRMWASLANVSHMRYDGVAYTDEYPPSPVLVGSRIMIDRKLYDGMARDNAPRVVHDSPPHGYRKGNDDAYVFPDPYALLSELSDGDAAQCPALVYGFSLEDKQWLKFSVNHITEIKWREESFDRLVLPRTQKKLIKGLVEAQAANNAQFDDFIEGKGRGLVLNLFGPPGVGKTLSAEATSEHLRRPLYVVGAGDLGTSPPQLDGALTRIFKLGSAWHAVVLIDEADVYLEQRSTHDLARNALVSVFLRQIEYFAGVLFLTTNRVRTFDEAFQSRIHVSLRYYELDEDARRTLWRSFLNQVGGELSSAEEDTLAALPLNGRQIKNAVRTAGAVASSSSEQVSYGHIKEVVDIMKQFEEDFSDLKGVE